MRLVGTQLLVGHAQPVGQAPQLVQRYPFPFGHAEEERPGEPGREARRQHSEAPAVAGHGRMLCPGKGTQPLAGNLPAAQALKETMRADRLRGLNQLASRPSDQLAGSGARLARQSALPSSHVLSRRTHLVAVEPVAVADGNEIDGPSS